jgi:hypothetical protein
MKMSCFRIRHTYRIQNINERMLRREHANKRHLGGSINVNFSVRQYVAVKNLIKLFLSFGHRPDSRYLIRSELVIT